MSRSQACKRELREAREQHASVDSGHGASALRRHVAESSALLDERSAALPQLRQQLASATEKLDAVLQSERGLLVDNALLRERLGAASERASTLAHEREGAEKEARAQAAALNTARERTQELELKVATLSAQMSVASIETVAGLRAELSACRADLAARDADLVGLRRTAGQQQAQEKERDEAQRALAASRATVVQLESERAALGERISQLDLEVASKKKALEQSRSMIDEYVSEVEQLRSECQLGKNTTSRHQSQHEELQRELATLQARSWLPLVPFRPYSLCPAMLCIAVNIAGRQKRFRV
jgi:chromosome segregation ATPase